MIYEDAIYIKNIYYMLSYAFKTLNEKAYKKIEKLSLADGNNFKIDTHTTQTAEQEQGFFRKYFGKYYGDDKRQGIFQSKFGNK